MTTIKVPNFAFTGLYYPQLLEALTIYKRINVPELSDESDAEPFMHLLKMMAGVGHLNNVLLDILANESTLPTSRLAETVRNMLRLIGYELRSAAPAIAPMLYRLNQVLTSTKTVVPSRALVSTRRDDSGAVVWFENLSDLTCTRTDQVAKAYAERSGVYTDVTTQVNAGTTFAPWSGNPVAGDKLYLSHPEALWDRVDVDVVTPTTKITVGVWEYYDDDDADANPDSATNMGSTIKFYLNGMLGDQDRSGTLVKVRLNSSGVTEEVESDWDGTDNTVTTTLLGQSSPSEVAGDYVVGRHWKALSVSDGTELATQTGAVSYDVPQSETANWVSSAVNSVEGYWLRFRVVSAAGGGPEQLSLGAIQIDGGKQYCFGEVVQGRHVFSETIGSSNGDVKQSFRSANTAVILGTEEVRVDGEVWTRVNAFLGSGPADKVYKLELGADDRATYLFGDGSTGAIPPVGASNIVSDYRFDAAANGNVGANAITVDKGGLAFVDRIFNPRAASGWAESQAASTESLEAAKDESTVGWRTKDTAISPDDLVDMALAYVSANGSKPFGRAFALEEGFGPKTTELILVLRGGGVPTTEQLQELQDYFNGTATSRKRFVTNQQVGASAYNQKLIDVNATVYAPRAVSKVAIENALAALLQPEAKNADGDFAWKFGGTIKEGRISHEIFSVDSRITDVELAFSDVLLLYRELPGKGAINVNMVATD